MFSFSFPGSPVQKMIAASAAVVFLVGAIFASPVQAAVKIQDVSSQSGVLAWLVQDRSRPIITLNFSFKGGSTQDPDGKEGIANLMTGLMDEGAGRLSSDAFQKRMDELGMEMRFHAGRDDITGEMRVLSENSDEAMELLRLALTEPRFDTEPVERIRDQIATGIKSDARDPSQEGRRALRQALYGDHPYARPSDGTLESLAAIAPDDLKEFHRRVFARSNLIIGVVGDIDPETLRTMLDKVFGELPEKAELTPVDDIKPQLGEELWVDYALPQARLSLVYPGIPRDDPQFFAAYLMNHILGGGAFSSRLYNEVREKRGLAYGISSYLAGRDHAQTLMIHTATAAAQLGETLAVIEEVVSRMRDEGPSEEELAAAKTHIIGAYPIEHLDSSTSIAATLVRLQEDRLGTDYIARRADIINAVTLDEVRQAARRLLTEKPGLLVIGPKEKPGG